MPVRHSTDKERGLWFLVFGLLGDVDADLAAFQLVKESLTEGGPLEDDGRDQKVERDGAVAVALQERHQETEADEAHDVDLLEHCKENRSESRVDC